MTAATGELQTLAVTAGSQETKVVGALQSAAAMTELQMTDETAVTTAALGMTVAPRRTGSMSALYATAAIAELQRTVVMAELRTTAATTGLQTTGATAALQKTDTKAATARTVAGAALGRTDLMAVIDAMDVLQKVLQKVATHQSVLGTEAAAAELDLAAELQAETEPGSLFHG